MAGTYYQDLGMWQLVADTTHMFNRGHNSGGQRALTTKPNHFISWVECSVTDM